MYRRSCIAALCILLILGLSVMLAGCGKVAEKATEKATEEAIEKSTGGEAQVDINDDQVTVKNGEGTAKIGGSNEWPANMPSDVPKFSGGKIVSIAETTVNGGVSIMVGIDGATEDDLKKFKTDLEAEGWNITTSSTEDAFVVMAEKTGGRSVVESFGGKTETGHTGGIYYTEEKQ